MFTYEILENKIIKFICQFWFLLKVLSLILFVFYLIPYITKQINKEKIIILKRSIKKKSTFFCYVFLITNLYNSIYYMCLYGWLTTANDQKIQKILSKIVVLDSSKEFSALLSDENPLIVFSNHLGCFFIPIFYKPLWDKMSEKKRMSVLSPTKNQKRKILIKEKMNNSYFNDFDFIDVMNPTTSVSKLIKALRSNGIVCTATDTYHNHTNNLNIDFLGNPYQLPAGIIKIGLKYNCNCAYLTTTIKRGKIYIEAKQKKEPLIGNSRLFVDIEKNFISLVLDIEKQIMKNLSNWGIWNNYLSQINENEIFKYNYEENQNEIVK